MSKSTIPEKSGLIQQESATGYISIATLVDIDDNGKPLVDFPENPEEHALVALSTQPLSRQHSGRQVALGFNNGDLRQPVIMGLIHNPLEEVLRNFELTPVDDDSEPDPEHEEDKRAVRELADFEREGDEKVYVDGKQVVIEGSEEVTFKCGKASITLTQSGKIIIRGTYLLNRSSGVNRIMGGSVQIN